MKQIFEIGDLVRRDLVLISKRAQDGFKGTVVCTLVGIKTEDKDRYEQLAIITYDVNGQVFGRKFENVIIDDDFKKMLKCNHEKWEQELSDEGAPTLWLAHVWEHIPIKDPITGKENVTYDFNPMDYIERECQKAITSGSCHDCESDSILGVEVGTNGHQWSTASGHGTYTHIHLEDKAGTRCEVNVKKTVDGMFKSLDFFLDGDAELDNAIEAARFIADELTKMSRKNAEER